jgi:hypothetical protein
MGHYDSCYEAEQEADQKRQKKLALNQLERMETFLHTLHKSTGIGGISTRHLDQFQDMINATKVRTL